MMVIVEKKAEIEVNFIDTIYLWLLLYSEVCNWWAPVAQ